MKRAVIFLVILTVLLAAAAAAVHITMPDLYARWLYPLDHSDLITRSADQNQLDPALVAAIIFEESGFEDGIRSDAGAVGLMQLMPSTAVWIAGKTGGKDFTAADLRQPAINIAYGCWYLRYLIDRYGSSDLALAAYNGGTENTDQWLADARSKGRDFNSDLDVPWHETREYISRVDKTRDIYQRAYKAELGI
ncbi:MAG: lytic transglycosylase domain-containing protein [Thermoleophilia bacterium]